MHFEGTKATGKFHDLAALRQAAYAWDEGAAFHIGNIAPLVGDGYTGAAPGNLYSPYEQLEVDRSCQLCLACETHPILEASGIIGTPLMVSLPIPFPHIIRGPRPTGFLVCENPGDFCFSPSFFH